MRFSGGERIFKTSTYRYCFLPKEERTTEEVAQSPPDIGRETCQLSCTWEVTGDQSCFVEWWGQRSGWCGF